MRYFYIVMTAKVLADSLRVGIFIDQEDMPSMKHLQRMAADAVLQQKDRRISPEEFMPTLIHEFANEADFLAWSKKN